VTVETTYAPPVADIERPRSRALMAGGIGLLACAIGFFVDRDQFFRSWLIAYMLFLGIALGSLACCSGSARCTPGRTATSSSAMKCCVTRRRI
jgi:hypothetical protein